MLSSRDYKVISLALSFLQANLDEIADMHLEHPLHDLEDEEVPDFQEIDLLLVHTRKMSKLSKSQIKRENFIMSQ